MSKIKNSSEDIYNYLLLEYRKKVMKVEMEVFQARQTRMLNKIQRYFNSTPIRNAFQGGWSMLIMKIHFTQLHI